MSARPEADELAGIAHLRLVVIIALKLIDIDQKFRWSGFTCEWMDGHESPLIMGCYWICLVWHAVVAMQILVLNSGSSSLKFQLIETDPERVLAHGLVDKIGHPDASVTYEAAGSSKSHFAKTIPDHKDAIQAAFDCMRQSEGVLGDLQDI